LRSVAFEHYVDQRDKGQAVSARGFERHRPIAADQPASLSLADKHRRWPVARNKISRFFAKLFTAGTADRADKRMGRVQRTGCVHPAGAETFKGADIVHNSKAKALKNREQGDCGAFQ
jgi:hypothetical protein